MTKISQYFICLALYHVYSGHYCSLKFISRLLFLFTLASAAIGINQRQILSSGCNVGSRYVLQLFFNEKLLLIQQPLKLEQTNKQDLES